MPLTAIDLLNIQLHPTLRQQCSRDLRDSPVLDMVTITDDRQCFQPGEFFTMVGFGVVPAGRQTVGGKPQSLILFIGVAG